MRQVARVVSVILLVAGLAAGQGMGGSQKQPRKRTVASQDVSAQLSQMQKSIDAQQQQIQQLMKQLQSRNEQVQQLQQQMNQVQGLASQAQQKAEATASQSTQQQQDVVTVRNDVADLKMSATNTALALQETQKSLNEAESPLALRFKGITITPGGFLAAESVWRQHAVGSDINTPFNAIPFDGASQSNLSEFYGSGRQSRVSLLAEGKLSKAKLSGYFEADFLTTGITSNNNQSNSYGLRQRQVWGQAALNNGWSFTAGQMWSLITETKNGVDNRTEAPPQTIDPAYNAGFSWARQYGFRVSKNFSNRFWLAFAVENPQTTVGGHGSSTNFLLGQQGASGGLYNPTANYSFNAMPDLLAKFVFQPKNVHFEVFGVASRFRDRIFPLAGASTPSADGAFNNSEMGGGVGANVRVSVLNKRVDLGLHFLGGDGIGRYGASGLADVTVRPDGVLVPIRSYQSLATLETHGKKLDLYLNAGGEFAGRTAFTAGTKGVGYGSNLFNNSGCSTETPPGGTVGAAGTPLSNGFNPGSLSSCTGDTRSLIEGTAGFWFRFYKGPKGTLQFGPQYSYLVRSTWSDATGISPQATENMFLTSFRYYLP
jgi:hypothetical protein